ncbi:tissue factor-like [Arapaima gigas]
MEKKIFLYFGLIFFVLLGDIISGEDYFPRAQSVTWSSNNFKTILMWNPKPSNHSYTVEVFALEKDRERNPNCIRSTSTECDLTNMLTDLKKKYQAEVLSEPLLGMTSDLIEFPYTRSEEFSPYTDTSIGRPDFTVEVNKEKTKITLHIQSPLSPIYSNGKLLNIRDIFQDDLKYRVTYRKAKSTGKKVGITDTDQIVLDVEQGESYCFYVQAFIPSRKGDKQLGEQSKFKCSPIGEKSLLEEYGLVVISCAALGIVISFVFAIILLWVCCKRCRAKNGKKGEPYSHV